MSVADKPTVEFDHHSPEFGKNQPERFAEMRSRCPIAYTESHGGFWVASTYEYAHRVLTEVESFTVERNPDGSGGKLIPDAPHSPVIVPGSLDGEEHDRLRGPLRSVFARAPIEEKGGPIVRRIASELADGLVDRDEFDFANEFSFMLTVGTIFEFVGLREVDDKPKMILMLENAFAIEPEAGNGRDALALSVASEYQEAADLVRRVVRARTASPTDDLISYMVRPEAGLSEDDVVALTLSMVLGGVRTTASSLDNMIWHLDEHRDLRRRLIDDPSAIPDAVYEMIRLYSVTPLVARTALTDVEFGDVVVRKGERVAALLAAANLDDERFSDPETVKLDRSEGLHLAFGMGMHYCMGIWMARMELRIALETILARMPDYRVVREKTERYARVGVNNGFAKLTVRPRP